MKRGASVMAGSAGAAAIALFAGGAFSAAPLTATTVSATSPVPSHACVQTPAPPPSPLPVSAQGEGSLTVAGSGGSMSASSSKGIQLCFSGPSGGLPSLP